MVAEDSSLPGVQTSETDLCHLRLVSLGHELHDGRADIVLPGRVGTVIHQELEREGIVEVGGVEEEAELGIELGRKEKMN